MIKGEWKDPHKRRDRLHIMAQIIEITKDGSLKTQIMYKANLSFAQLNEYLTFLREMKLIEIAVNEDKSIYRATHKGFEYLKSYKQIRDLLLKKEDKTPTLFSSFSW